MASVKVAVRVRPLNRREIGLESQFIIDMDGKKTSITNVKVPIHKVGDASRERTKEFTFDHSYFSVDSASPEYASQGQVFKDLGLEVVQSAYQGYNACVFAYGQTGSGKTYTMMGNEGDVGLIPRICEELFARMSDPSMTYRTEVSYLEIYNEKVRDLLRDSNAKVQHTLRVREHPKLGPYVQDLSRHLVVNFGDIKALMDKGNLSRTTASTNMNDVSSRSHAIFTVMFTQAQFSPDMPRETHSKIHLVDLAGSERADATGATGQRLKEGSSINRSLVTLGSVISTLADLSDKTTSKKSAFIPYRDSVLTWLLKDSLGGNSKTIMIATISPADCNYAETLSTLRYANRAKNIINKPTVNEDPNVKLIKELREEITRLKTMLGGSLDKISGPRVKEKLHEKEARVKVLTEEWTGKWKEIAHILQEEKTLALRKEGLGVVLDSELPHLIGIDDDILSTGIMLYHLKEGKTSIGTGEASDKQDIVLQGSDVQSQHCIIEHQDSQVTLIPIGGAPCTVNGSAVVDPIRLAQGAVILLGKTNMFRFNHPAQAAKLRQELKGSNLNMTRISSLSQSMSDLARSTENLALITSGWEMEQRHMEQLEALEVKRQEIEDMEERHRQAESARLTEQSQQERHLEEKRQLLVQMQTEAELVKKEAEQLQKHMEEERAKLQQRSADMDRQLQQYLQQQSRGSTPSTPPEGQEQGTLERHLEEERKKIIAAMKAELGRLEEQQQVQAEQARQARETLSKQMADLESRESMRQDSLKAQERVLQDRQAGCQQRLTDIQAEVDSQRQLIQAEKRKELEMLDRERQHLESMKEDYTSFYKVTAELDASVRQQLERENERIENATDALKHRETELYELFQAEQQELNERKASLWAELSEERGQLQADKVYLAECQAQFEEASLYTDRMTDAELQQLEKEQAALKEETAKITNTEKLLEAREEQVVETCDADLKQLLQKRDEQIESLRQEREQVREMEDRRNRLIDEEISKNIIHYDQLSVSVHEGERKLAQLEKKLELATAELEANLAALDTERVRVDESASRQAAERSESVEELTQQQRTLEERVQTEQQLLADRKHRLEELLARQEAVGDSEEELAHQWELFRKFVQETQDSLEDQQGTAPSGDDTVETAQLRKLEAERGHLDKRMDELRSLAEAVHSGEWELEERRRRFEEERQHELDKIDMEKFTLQEMEDQERINALVEQEVKRRLFEERVQREKQRRIERERERMERETELMRIKKAHDRELQRLREKYEANNINMNVPTKANPYASPMIGDVAPRPLSRPRSCEPSPDSPVSTVSSTSIYHGVMLSIPGYIQRGSGLDTHYEFEVKLAAGEDAWSVFRRYSRFRELHQDLKNKYPQVAALAFPPKKWFASRSEKVVAERRRLLEDYLRAVIEVLQRNSDCVLHPSRTKLFSKHILHEFHPFFKKGLFETSKHGTA